MSPAAEHELQLVLFDLDGTLVATAPEICDAVNDTLGAMGLQGVQLHEVEIWIGHGTGWLLLQALARATGRSPDGVQASTLWTAAQARFAIDYERRCGTTSHLYPHAREMLQALGERGVQRALVTNKERRFTLPVLRRHGLARCFERVVCGDTLPRRKPDPAGVLHCLDALGVPAEAAAFVGDSSIDVETARNAGVAAWAVTHGYNMGQPIALARPDRLLHELQAVLDPIAQPTGGEPSWP